MPQDLVAPVVLGEGSLPDPGCGRPIIFVGNHGKMGLYDMPLLMMELYMRGEDTGGHCPPFDSMRPAK